MQTIHVALPQNAVPNQPLLIHVPPHGMPYNVMVPPHGRPGMVIPFMVPVGPMPPPGAGPMGPPPPQQQQQQPGGMPPQMMMGGMRPMQPGIPGVGVPPPGGPGRYGGPASGAGAAAAAAAVKPREKKVLKITVSSFQMTSSDGVLACCCVLYRYIIYIMKCCIDWLDSLFISLVP